MININNAIPTFLRITLDHTKPFISVSMQNKDTCVLEATNSGSPHQQKEMIDTVITKLKKTLAHVTQEGPEDAIPQAIFMLALENMKTETSEPKELSQYRIVLADALKCHIEAPYFFRTKSSEPGDSDVEKLRVQLESSLVLTTPAESKEQRKRARSGSGGSKLSTPQIGKSAQGRRPSISMLQVPQFDTPSLNTE